MDFKRDVNDLNSNGLEESREIHNIYGEGDIREELCNDNEKIREKPLDEKPMENDRAFHKEVIEKRPKKWGRMALIMIFILGLTLGTVLEYVADNFIGYLRGQNIIYAAEGQKYNYIIDKTVSPVVPIAKKVSPSIVAIKIKKAYRDWFGSRYESESTGSGIIIDAEGHIVTNNHVVENSNDIIVVLNSGKELSAKVVGRDAATDLAVIKVDEKNLPYAELGDSSKLEVGELAVAIGSPMGTDYAGSVTAGIISGLNRKVPVGDRPMTLIQTDAAINPGNSGGALVNSEGKVVGINTVKFVENRVEGMGFAIPINESKPIIQQLIKNKKVYRPYLGIQGQTIDKETAKQYNVPRGVLVVAVIKGSGAEKAGMERGDIITKIDGKTINTVEELIEIVRGHKLGDVLKVEVYGSLNRYRTVNVKLMESNE
ncbi:MAG: PDZ domain-containing protein [Clostridiales bacterium]|nr:PDZ domain-containing protein [Clostridiales bacterium]